MKAKKPVSADLRKTKNTLIEEIASLRAKLEKFESVSSAKENRLHKFSGMFNLGFWEWDAVKNEVVYYSDEMALIFGVSLSDLYDHFKVEEDFYTLVHPEDLPHFKDHMQRCAVPGQAPGQGAVFDYRIIRPDGEVRHLRELEYDVVMEKGKEIYTYGVVQDITEHQESALGLKVSEERYSSLFAQLPIGVLEEDYSAVKRVVDDLRYEGVESLKKYFANHPEILRELVSGVTITHANESLLNIYRAKSQAQFIESEANMDDWWDANWAEFYADEIDALAGPEHNYAAERVDNRVDGSYIETRSITSLVRGYEDSWARVITTYEDITERKSTQAALLEAKNEAEESNQAKSEFLSCMSHELRTPLNTILGFSQLAELDPKIGKEQRSYARKINNAGKHLLILIEEILDLSRIETGEVELSMEPVSLVDVISDSMSWLAGLAERRGVKFDFDPTQLDGILVEADAIKLKQIFLNLLTNAVKYNKLDGSVSINCYKHAKGLIRIGIQDTGPGISPDRLNQLFQPFNRLGAEFSEVEGTGIGLVITQKLINLMNGRLVVESTPGEGSIFWIELQSLKLSDNKGSNLYIVPKKHTRASALVTAVNPKILVAEDNPVNQELIATQMKALGYDADYALNGSEALELWESKEYDLLITDISMPVMDGFELIRQVREKELDTGEVKPIIAITANAMEQDKKRCFDAGVNDLMTKPVDLEDLRISLARWSPRKDGINGEIEKDNHNQVTGIGEVVDMSVLRNSVGDKNDIHQKLLNSYISMIPKSLDEIQIAFAWRNHELLNEYVHKLKSSSRSVGAVQMSRLCRVIEVACMENRWDDIESSMSRLKELAIQVEAFVEVFSSGVMLETAKIDLPTLLDIEEEVNDIDLSILVVDDDYITHKVTTLLLNDLGIHNVHTALSAARGLEILDEQDAVIDVVICDLNMPGMDGIEFTRRLAERKYTGSLILLSGEEIRILKTVEKLAIEHELHVLGVMEKPVTQIKLSALLRTLDQIKSEKSLILSKDLTARDLSEAISQDKMDIYFQPKVDIRTQRVVGLEALVRWNHPTEGILHPNTFVPMAEENDLIYELTMSVCQQALAHAVRLQNEGFDLNIGINISVDALNDLDWPDKIEAETRDAGLQTSSITFEITESRLMENISVALDILNRLSLKRFNLSIDDFGTGYSSMEQLQRIPFSELKIDRAFVRGASEDSSARAILESNHMLAKKLNMSIVAEGVETQEDWDLVTELGCDQAQGYFVARPMPIDDLCVWLRSWRMPDR